MRAAKQVVDPEKDPLAGVLSSTPCLWKGRQKSRQQAGLPTGYAGLDRNLPGGGWPLGAITELFTAWPGRGEFSLLFPALAAAGEQGHWLLLIDPPWIPYAATLHGHGLCLERLLLIRTRDRRESLWACEQALRSTPGNIVLAWPRHIRFPALRRLQLAAETQSGMAFLFRPEAMITTASPAALRLRLESELNATRIEILKCRGHAPAKPIFLRHAQDSGTPFHDHGRPLDITRARAFVAGDTVVPPGAGLPYTRPARARQTHRHH